jgi:hypothetical protein
MRPEAATTDVALPDDLDTLKAMIRELLTLLKDRDRELDGVRQRLDQLLRRLYGPKSDRHRPDQPGLFDDPQDAAAAEPERADAGPPRRRGRHGAVADDFESRGAVSKGRVRNELDRLPAAIPNGTVRAIKTPSTDCPTWRSMTCRPTALAIDSDAMAARSRSHHADVEMTKLNHLVWGDQRCAHDSWAKGATRTAVEGISCQFDKGRRRHH